ncbi:hypothetical protein XENTR_v10015251 [Xenopus tropicalis]|nr:hypothetical protein XENTR_v10015251 [Xenopus tropicalis]
MTCGDTTKKGTTCVQSGCATSVKHLLSQYTDYERHSFAKYLAHTNKTAERSYREKTLDDTCHVYLLVSRLTTHVYHPHHTCTGIFGCIVMGYRVLFITPA